MPVHEALARATEVLVLGDSLTEGYGVAKDDAYPEVLEQLLKKSGHPDVTVVNAGISGSTSASGPSRMKWELKRKPDILILALGANDGLRGLKPGETEKNLRAVIELAKKNGIQVLLAGMLAPPNYGKRYSEEFKKIYTDLARSEHVRLIPFLLAKVAGVPALNQSDGIHPNKKGHEIVAHTVLKYLEPLL